MPRTLIITDFGTYAGLASERVVVKQNSEVIKEIPLFRIDGIIITQQV